MATKNSPVITPINDIPIFIFKVEIMLYTFAGNITLKRICNLFAPNDFINNIFSLLTFSNPTNIFIVDTINEISIAMIIIDFIPEPNHIKIIGPKATLGRAFNTIRYGSNIFDIVSDHHKIIAINIPSKVPNVKPNIVKESIDQTGAAFNLTKLKGYLRFETRWEYDEDYPEDAMLVDKVHEPPRFTVNWIGPEGKKHPNTYCVNIRKDRGESWTWITHFCLKASDAAEMINLEVGVWEHNNEPWRFGENKDALFEKLLEE